MKSNQNGEGIIVVRGLEGIRWATTDSDESIVQRLVQFLNGKRMKLMKVLKCWITSKQLVSKRQNSKQQFWQLESNEDLVKPSIGKKNKNPEKNLFNWNAYKLTSQIKASFSNSTNSVSKWMLSWMTTA